MQRDRFLMSSADHFEVNYEINPWMTGQIDQVNHDLAATQWRSLYDRLTELAEVTCITPQPNLPDMVFTANAALIREKTCLLSHFRHLERRGEEQHFATWFRSQGYDVFAMPEDVFFEGAGDALFHRSRDLLWLGYGFRSDAAAQAIIHEHFAIDVIPLKLIDKRFYHLDTCFCPLSDGYLMYYPPAFADPELIEHVVPAEKRLIVNEENALRFACNAVEIGPASMGDNPSIVMNACDDSLKQQLTELGYEVILLNMSEFIKAGGATKCLTLKLNELP